MASTHCLLSGGARRELQGHLAAQARLEGDQLQRVLEGEDVIIAKAGKPVAVLSPLPSTAVRRIPGNDAGTVIITPAFDEPLPEFDEL